MILPRHVSTMYIDDFVMLEFPSRFSNFRNPKIESAHIKKAIIFFLICGVGMALQTQP